MKIFLILCQLESRPVYHLSHIYLSALERWLFLNGIWLPFLELFLRTFLKERSVDSQ